MDKEKQTCYMLLLMYQIVLTIKVQAALNYITKLELYIKVKCDSISNEI